jgi:hypothetical protein
MKDAISISKNISFQRNVPPGIVAYIINGKSINDHGQKILVILNGNNTSLNVTIPKDKWKEDFLVAQIRTMKSFSLARISLRTLLNSRIIFS